MQIISRNSEKRLLRDLRSLWQNQPEHRCLQLKFSQIDEYDEKWPLLISQELTDFFEDVFLDMYVCFDNDIFITNRTITHKRVEQLLTHLKPNLGLAKDKDLLNLIISNGFSNSHFKNNNIIIYSLKQIFQPKISQQ